MTNKLFFLILQLEKEEKNIKNWIYDVLSEYPILSSILGTLIIIIFLLLKYLPKIKEFIESYEFFKKKVTKNKKEDQSSVIEKGLVDPEKIIEITNPENDYVREETESNVDSLADLIRDKNVTSEKQRKRQQIITVIGPPGIGKTRLVQEVCSKELFKDFPVQRYIDFEAINSPTNRDKTTEDKIFESASEQIKNALGSGGVDTNDFRAIARDFQKPTILFFDNYEQILDNQSLHNRIWKNLIRPFVESNDLIKVIITSRQKIEGAKVFKAKPLTNATEELVNSMNKEQLLQKHTALRLFCKIHNQILDKDENMELYKIPFSKKDFLVMIELCEKVSCLPLGIHLMASRSTEISLSDILEDLKFYINEPIPNTFSEFGDRHTDLYSVFRWSFDALTDEEKVFFRHLIYFQNGFYKKNLPVWSGFKSKAETNKIIAKLYQKSFLRKQEVELESSKDRFEYDRYEVYVLFKELIQLPEKNFEENLNQDYLNQIYTNYDAMLAEMTDNVFGTSENLNLNYLKKDIRLEYENITYFIEECSRNRKDLAVNMLVRLEELLNEIGPYLKLENLFNELLENVTDPTQKARLLMGKARVLKSSEDRELSSEPIKESIKLLEAKGEINNILGNAYNIGAYLSNQLGDNDIGKSILKKVNGLNRTDQMKLGQLNFAMIRSKIARDLELNGKIDEAISELKSIIELLEGYKLQQAKTLNSLGIIYWRQGEPNKAIKCFHQAEEKYEGIGEDRWILGIRTNLGLVYCDNDELETSERITSEAYETLKHQGPISWAQINVQNSGRIYSRKPKKLENFLKAEKLLLESYNNLESLKYWESLVLSTLELSELYFKYEHFDKASEFLDITIAIAKKEKLTKLMRYFRALCLFGLILHKKEDLNASKEQLNQATAMLNEKWLVYWKTRHRYNQLKELHA